jgi:hypothetical protein
MHFVQLPAALGAPQNVGQRHIFPLNEYISAAGAEVQKLSARVLLL